MIATDPLELSAPGPLGILVGPSPDRVFANGKRAVRAIWRGPRGDVVFCDRPTEAEARATLAEDLHRLSITADTGRPCDNEGGRA